jgi:mediator of RNA polymerase II transcription subunit 14
MSYLCSRHPPARPPSHAPSVQLPLLGGTLRIELLTTPDPIRKPHARALTELQDRAKLGERRPSDTVEGTKWNVVWEPAPLALGIALTTEGAIPSGELTVVRARLGLRRLNVISKMRGQDAQDLDFERLIRSVIRTHTRAIFREFALRLRNNPVFSLPGAVEVAEEGMHPILLRGVQS